MWEREIMMMMIAYRGFSVFINEAYWYKNNHFLFLITIGHFPNKSAPRFPKTDKSKKSKNGGPKNKYTFMDNRDKSKSKWINNSQIISSWVINDFTLLLFLLKPVENSKSDVNWGYSCICTMGLSRRTTPNIQQWWTN